MNADEKTIEMLIADWYASGECDAACARAIINVTEQIAAQIVRTFPPRVAYEVESKAVSHVFVGLRGGVVSGKPTDRYDPARPFRAWCYRVVKRLAFDCKDRAHIIHEQPIGGEDDGPSVLGNVPDRRPARVDFPSDSTNLVTALLAEIDRCLSRPEDRIIVAVQTGFADALPDEVLARWLDAADMTVSVESLRELVGRLGVLKALAELLGMEYCVVRARSSRAMRDLQKGDFKRLVEEGG